MKTNYFNTKSYFLRKWHRAFIGVMCAMLFFTHSALAEGDVADETDDYTLEDTVVTATKTGETNLQETPIAITAFSEEALKTRGTFNLMELGSPNLNVMAGQGEQNFYIRGIGSENNSYLKEPNVGIYIDGVYMEKGLGAMADFIDVERVEILRGPQGTLYGRNSTGGAINLLTAPPTDEFYAKVMIEAASFSKFRIDTTVSGPIVEDKLNARITANSNQWDGHYNIIGTPNDQSNESKTVKAALDFKVSDTVNFVLRGDYEDSKSLTPFGNFVNDAELAAMGPMWWNIVTLGIPGVIPGFNPGNTKPYSFVTADGFYDVVAVDPQSHYNKENYGLSGHLTVKLPFDANLRSVTSYRGFYRDVLSNNAFGAFAPALQEDDVKTFTQELQLDGKAGSLNYLVGLYYYQLRQELTIDQDAIFFNPLAAHLIADIGTDAYAFFSTFSYTLFDRFSLSAGLRYSYEEKTIDSSDTKGFFPTVFTNKEGDWDALTPKFSAEG